MKTKELIRQLQQEDPSGELEVCVGNIDIHFVEKMEAYYDGCLQVLKRDENMAGYNIVGAKITHENEKVKIHTLSIKQAIAENPDLVVEIDEWCKDLYEDAVAQWRKEAKEE